MGRRKIGGSRDSAGTGPGSTGGGRGGGVRRVERLLGTEGQTGRKEGSPTFCCRGLYSPIARARLLDSHAKHTRLLAPSHSSLLLPSIVPPPAGVVHGTSAERNFTTAPLFSQLESAPVKCGDALVAL